MRQFAVSSPTSNKPFTSVAVYSSVDSIAARSVCFDCAVAAVVSEGLCAVQAAETAAATLVNVRKPCFSAANRAKGTRHAIVIKNIAVGIDVSLPDAGRGMSQSSPSR